MTAISEVVNARLSKMRSAYEENGGGMRGIAAATMEGIRGCYEDGWNIVDKLTGGKLTNIKNAIQEKMNSAKDAVSQAIEKIKGVFNFEWKWPPLKLPHFTISGSFSLNPPSIPKIGVSWYAKGGILNAPTIFGSMGGKLLGGGEAGQEAVLPLSDFYSNLDSIMGKYLRGRTGMLVELNIEHFENNSDRDVDALADQVAERIDHKIQKEGAVFA